MPGLGDVFATPTANHRDLSAYAASWAAVAMLAQHPHWRRLLATTEQGPLDGTLTERLTTTRDWDADRAERDFDAFTDELDYGYEQTRSAIDWSPGRPLTAARRIAVAADRGWQNSGWSLRKGEQCAVEASGRCTIGTLPASPSGPECRLETEADGISLRWYRGRPLGRLLVAQWVQRPEDGGRPRFVVLAAGATGQFTAAADGVAYLKINDPPGELADNEGRFVVEIHPK